MMLKITIVTIITRQVNVGTSQAVGTPPSTTRGGSKPFAHTVHLVRN